MLISKAFQRQNYDENILWENKLQINKSIFLLEIKRKMTEHPFKSHPNAKSLFKYN